MEQGELPKTNVVEPIKAKQLLSNFNPSQQLAEAELNKELFGNSPIPEPFSTGNAEAIIAGKLKPRIEKDTKGFRRVIYTLGNSSFAFKGRDELPFYSEAATSSRTIHLGEESNWTSQEEYQDYLHKLSHTTNVFGDGEHIHYVVDKTLLGVIDLARQLGNQDPSLRQLHSEIQEGKYSRKALLFLDALMAVNYCDDQSDKPVFTGKPYQHAEALMVLALTGDEQAQAVVLQRTRSLQKIMEAKRTAEQQQIEIWKTRTKEKPFSPDELMCVHTLNVKPGTNEKGEYVLPTAFNLTKGKILRTTKHFSINGLVTSHEFNSWDEAQWVVVDRFSGIVKRNNRLPGTLAGFDTYWTLNPGENLVLPDATLIAPSEGEISGLFEKKGKVIEFKTKGYCFTDLRQLCEYAKGHEYIDGLSVDLNNTISEAITEFDKSIGSGIYSSLRKNPTLIADLIMGADVSETSLIPVLRQVFASIGVDTDFINKFFSQEDSPVGVLPEPLLKSFNGFMFSNIKDAAVRSVLEEYGCVSQPIGKLSWGKIVYERGSGWVDSDHKLNALAFQLGIANVGAHVYSAERDLEKRAIEVVKAALEKDGDKTRRFDWAKYNPIFEDLLPRLPIESLRTMYASGLLVARVE